MNTKILFICSANCDRSPTAEAVFKQYPGLETRSTGVFKPDKEIRDCLRWAEVIVVMEKHHENEIRRRYGEMILSKPVYSLDIPDDYMYMQDSLVELLRERMRAVLADLPK